MNKEKNSKIAFVHFLYKYTLLWCSSTTSSYDRWPAEKKIWTLSLLLTCRRVYQTTSVHMTIYNKYFRLIVSIAYFISILTHLLFNYSFNCLERYIFPYLFGTLCKALTAGLDRHYSNFNYCPYGHLGNTVTTLFRPRYFGRWQNGHTLSYKKTGAPNGNFRENICSDDDLRSRIFGAFVVKFLACLPVLGFSNIDKMV